MTSKTKIMVTCGHVEDGVSATEVMAKCGMARSTYFHHLLYPEHVARSDFESLIGGTGDAPQTGTSAATVEQSSDRLKDEFFRSREFDAREYSKPSLTVYHTLERQVTSKTA